MQALHYYYTSHYFTYYFCYFSNIVEEILGGRGVKKLSYARLLLPHTF